MCRYLNCIGERIRFHEQQDIKLKQINMEKTIKMSLETAREIYKWVNKKEVKDSPMERLLLDNFTKEELENNNGFTWEESKNKRKVKRLIKILRIEFRRYLYLSDMKWRR